MSAGQTGVEGVRSSVAPSNLTKWWDAAGRNVPAFSLVPPLIYTAAAPFSHTTESCRQSICAYMGCVHVPYWSITALRKQQKASDLHLTAASHGSFWVTVDLASTCSIMDGKWQLVGISKLIRSRLRSFSKKKKKKYYIEGGGFSVLHTDFVMLS